jgi:hypothetical protein
MSKAIESIKAHEEERSMMNLAHAQADFLERYSAMMPNDRSRDDFWRELCYLIHLTYREAQQPLVKQLTDFVMHSNRPLLIQRDGSL